MKNSKKLLAFFILVTLIFSFTGCASLDYKKATKLMEEGRYEEAQKVFSEIKDYKDSNDKSEECLYKEAESLIDNDEFGDAKSILNELDNNEKTQELRKECDYGSAQKALSDKRFDDAIKKLEALGNYKDSEQLITECRYQNASYLLENNRLSEAITAFEGISGYKDADDQIKECYYLYAEQLYNENDLADAKYIFEQLEDYKDSSINALNAGYDIAVQLLDQEEYAEAAEEFAQLGDFKNSDEMMNECYYQEALLLYDEENYIEAKELLDSLGDYSDSLYYVQEINLILNPYDITGTWKAGVDIFNEYIVDYIEDYLGQFPEGHSINDYFDFSKLLLEMSLELNNDGTYYFSVNTDKLLKNITKQLKAAIPSIISEFIDLQAKENGMSLNDILSATGTDSIENLIPLILDQSLDEYTEEILTDINSAFAEIDFNSAGTYTIEDSQILMTTENGDSEIGYYEEYSDTIIMDSENLDLGMITFNR